MVEPARLAPALLLTAIALAFFNNLAGAPLFDLDEGAFGAATWEMLQRGDFVTTYLNGELRFDKPILIYWLQAASAALLGLGEWALRLPSALAATLWVYAVFAFARTRLGRDGAFAAALYTAGALGVLVIGRSATADALLNLLITLTLLDIWRFAETPRAAPRNRVFLWMGLGLLAKGPIAVFIPFVVSLAWFAWQRRLGHWRQAVFAPLGWAILVAVAGPWYLAEYLDQGRLFIDGFFLKHNVGRFSDTMEGHGGNPFYYMGALPLVLLPFAGLFLRTLGRLRAATRDGLDLFLWLWFGVVFLLFSLSGTQLPHYILYGATPLFLLMARYRERLASRALAYAPALLLFALLAALPELLEAAREYQRSGYVRAMLADGAGAFGPGYRLWTLAGLGAALAVTGWRALAPWRGLALLGLVQALVLGQAVLPALGEVQQGPVREAAQLAAELGGPVVMWRHNMPSFTLYRGAVTPRRDPLPGELVYTRVDRLDALGPHQVLYSRGGIVLARKGGGDG